MSPTSFLARFSLLPFAGFGSFAALGSELRRRPKRRGDSASSSTTASLGLGLGDDGVLRADLLGLGEDDDVFHRDGFVLDLVGVRREPIDDSLDRLGRELVRADVLRVLFRPQIVHQPFPASRRVDAAAGSPVAGDTGTPLRSSIPAS